MAQRIRKAVFPVGGLGTRFLPATKAMPKEMLCLVDKPLIQYGVEEAIHSGIDQRFISGIGKVDSGKRMVVLLDVEKILSKSEQTDLAQLPSE